MDGREAGSSSEVETGDLGVDGVDGVSPVGFPFFPDDLPVCPGLSFPLTRCLGSLLLLLLLLALSSLPSAVVLDSSEVLWLVELLLLPMLALSSSSFSLNFEATFTASSW